ncbi:MAG: Complex intermediate-associated protein 30, partial [Actinomycetota bacterium]
RSPAIEPRVAAEWSGRSGPQIVVEGDGRTWTVEVRMDDVTGGWIASLPTSSDSITKTTIPWTSFEPVTRFLDPREVDEPLDVRRIVSIAFYLVDGIEGPFQLGLVSIN